MQFVFGQDAIVGAYAAERLGIPLEPPFTSIGVVTDGGSLVGAIIYNGYNGSNIEITVYAPRHLNRQVIRAALAYPFRQLGVLRLTGRTKRSNRAMCRIFPKVGFVYEATLKHYFGPSRGDDALLFRMTKAEAARWIGD